MLLILRRGENNTEGIKALRRLIRIPAIDRDRWRLMVVRSLSHKVPLEMTSPKKNGEKRLLLRYTPLSSHSALLQN